MRDLILAGPGRDLRVDLFRGLALWVIFIDHTAENVLWLRTPLRLTIADAAEIFVLLAGYAAGLVYGRTMDEQGWGRAATATLRRAGVIYVANIVLVVLFTAVTGALGPPLHLEQLKLSPLVEQPVGALQELLLLRFQPAFVDILPLYVVLLAALALVLPLLRRPVLLLGLAFALWAAARPLSLNLPCWPDGEWFLNPVTWQALFLTGAVLGYRPPGAPARSVPFRWWLVTASLLVLALGKGVFLVRGAILRGWVEAPAWLAGPFLGVEPLDFADKTYQHPLRILSILALAYLAGHAIQVGAPWLRGRLAAPAVLAGQHSLPVFCAGVILSYLGSVVLEREPGWPWQLLVNLAGPVLLVAVAAVAAGLKQAGGAGPRSAAAAPVRPVAQDGRGRHMAGAGQPA